MYCPQQPQNTYTAQRGCEEDRTQIQTEVKVFMVRRSSKKKGKGGNPQMVGSSMQEAQSRTDTVLTEEEVSAATP